MMKFSLLGLFLCYSLSALAESACDVRPGTSVGIKVIEFVSGNRIHSKMPLREAHGATLLEEMMNLQEMGVCEEKILAQKCILKFEKVSAVNYISLYRGASKWNSWKLNSKEQAQTFVKNLKKAGFCS